MTYTLKDFSDGLPDNFGCKLAGGRTIYREAGWMWRERSDNQHFVSPDGSFERRRYLPADTIVEVTKE